MLKNILINYTGRTAAGAAHAYGMAKGLIEAGANVYAIVSKQADNYVLWNSLPLKKLVAIDTYTNKKEFLFSTLRFVLWQRFSLVKEFENITFSAIYVPMGTYWSYLISSQFSQVPVYYTIHDPQLHSGESLFNRLFLYVTQKEINQAHKVITLSECFTKDIARIYNRKLNDILIIPEAAFWEYKTEANKEPIVKYASGKMNFLFFGRIEKYKGLDTLLTAYEKLEDIYGDKVSLTIAGKGNISHYLKAMERLQNLTLINKLIPDEDIAGLFSGENVITVLPYKDATQSGVINTAFMFNSLVIATEVGAIRYQLAGGKYGVLIKPNNAKALYEAMKDITENNCKYREYIANAAEFINGLQWPDLAKKLIENID